MFGAPLIGRTRIGRNIFVLNLKVEIGQGAEHEHDGEYLYLKLEVIYCTSFKTKATHSRDYKHT